MARVDLVIKVHNILKAENYHGKYQEKSCVSWKIQGEGISDAKIIWEGESVVIENQGGKTNE